MKFEITIQKSLADIVRQIGYLPAYFQNDEEFSVVKKLGFHDYPRFHVYITQHGQTFSFNLHLDQKKPSYEGATGHNGEYDGELVEQEIIRIKSLLG